MTGTCFKDIEIPIRYKVTYLHIFTCLKHVTTTQPQPQTTYLILFFFLPSFLPDPSPCPPWPTHSDEVAQPSPVLRLEAPTKTTSRLADR